MTGASPFGAADPLMQPARALHCSGAPVVHPVAKNRVGQVASETKQAQLKVGAASEEAGCCFRVPACPPD